MLRDAEAQVKLPALTKNGIVSGYIKNELWKGLGWSTLGFALGHLSVPKLFKHYPNLKVLGFLKDKTLRNSLAAVIYLFPHLFNFFTYQKLSKTINFQEFEVGDHKSSLKSYTKFYFRPNPLKILMKRLLEIDNTSRENNSIYVELVKTLSIKNLTQLINYLCELGLKDNEIENKTDPVVNNIRLQIGTTIEGKIDSLDENTLVDFARYYTLLSSSKREDELNNAKSIKERVVGKLDTMFLAIIQIKDLNLMYNFLYSFKAPEMYKKLFAFSVEQINKNVHSETQQRSITCALIILSLLFVEVDLAGGVNLQNCIALGHKIKTEKIPYSDYLRAVGEVSNIIENEKVYDYFLLPMKLAIPFFSHEKRDEQVLAWYLVYMYKLSKLSLENEQAVKVLLDRQKNFLNALIAQFDEKEGGMIEKFSEKFTKFIGDFQTDTPWQQYIIEMWETLKPQIRKKA